MAPIFSPRENFKSHAGPKTSGFYTKGRLLVKSNQICPLDKLSWQPDCPVLNINIQGNFCISQGNVSSDNLPENLLWTPGPAKISTLQVLQVNYMSQE